jgi:hypothetical protein
VGEKVRRQKKGLLWRESGLFDPMSIPLTRLWLISREGTVVVGGARLISDVVVVVLLTD